MSTDNMSIKETVNVTKLIFASGAKLMYQRKDETSQLSLRPSDAKTFTASASPPVYYVSLTETSEVDLDLEPQKK